MELELWSIRMEMCILANGIETPKMDRASLITPTETCTKASGRKTSFTARANTLILMELFTLDSGKKTSNMVRAKSNGPMAQAT